MAAALSDVVGQIDKVAKAAGYQCRPVSWEDAQRGCVGGKLSAVGANISDVRLWEKGGKLLYTLRSDNWNERLGFVRPDELSVVVGNHVPGGASPTPATLRDYLRSIGDYGHYANVAAGTNLFDADSDTFFTVRFQCVFLPIAGNDHLEFCTEVYNYNTTSDLRPRNLLLLATPQGTAVQQDGAGAKRLFFHAVDPSGGVHRYWLEAERSRHVVGGAQVETAAEAAEAAARGKATAIHIGTRSMGTRFNAQMLIQVPLSLHRGPIEPSKRLGELRESIAELCLSLESSTFTLCKPSTSSDCLNSAPPRRRLVGTGTSNAARVSRGTEVAEKWFGVANAEPKRDTSQRGTVTVTLYYTVADGVPSEDDVRSAVDDLNALYASCESNNRLADTTLPVELMVKDLEQIAEKVTLQPYTPPVFAPAFPIPDDGE